VSERTRLVFGTFGRLRALSVEIACHVFSCEMEAYSRQQLFAECLGLRLTNEILFYWYRGLQSLWSCASLRFFEEISCTERSVLIVQELHGSGGIERLQSFYRVAVSH
jgi:hypothetical protein